MTMPNFLVVGAARAGSTSMYNYLGAHPAIYMSPVKEPHYFSFTKAPPEFCGLHDAKTNEKEIVASREDYEELFAGAGTETARGECSNSYLYFPHAGDAIKELIPDCRIIMMLRDPAERAWSHYKQASAMGHEDLSFEEALEKEDERLAANWRWHYQYRKQGLYCDCVKHFMDLFGADNVSVNLFDDYKNNRDELMSRLYSFLGVDPKFAGYADEVFNRSYDRRSSSFHNMVHEDNSLRSIAGHLMPQSMKRRIVLLLDRLNRGRRYAPPLNPETRRGLVEYFREDIIALQSLIKRDLSHWME